MFLVTAYETCVLSVCSLHFFYGGFPFTAFMHFCTFLLLSLGIFSRHQTDDIFFLIFSEKQAWTCDVMQIVS